MSRVIAALVVVCAVSPATASARVVRAETILPPGQSGVPSSPFVFDQLPLFQRLEFKPEPLGGGPGGGATQTVRPGTTIRRDAFGVPAIEARREADAWFAAGLAVAQDRLGEMELFKRRGSGRLAEILGESSLEDDVVARRDFYTDRELRRDVPAPPHALPGPGARVRRGRERPHLARAQRPQAACRPSSARSTCSSRTGSCSTRCASASCSRARSPAATAPSSRNLRALRDLGPERFATLLPLSVPGEITTIPENAGTFPSQPGRTQEQADAAYARSQEWLKTLPAAVDRPRGEGPDREGDARRRRSTSPSAACRARSCGRSSARRTATRSSSTARSSATRRRARSWSST